MVRFSKGSSRSSSPLRSALSSSSTSSTTPSTLVSQTSATNSGKTHDSVVTDTPWWHHFQRYILRCPTLPYSVAQWDRNGLSVLLITKEISCCTRSAVGRPSPLNGKIGVGVTTVTGTADRGAMESMAVVMALSVELSDGGNARLARRKPSSANAP